MSDFIWIPPTKPRAPHPGEEFGPEFVCEHTFRGTRLFLSRDGTWAEDGTFSPPTDVTKLLCKGVPEGIVFDGVMCVQGSVRVFDIVHGPPNVRDLPWTDRKKLVREAVEEIWTNRVEPYAIIRDTPVFEAQAQNWQGRDVILKRKDSPYDADWVRAYRPREG